MRLLISFFSFIASFLVLFKIHLDARWIGWVSTFKRSRGDFYQGPCTFVQLWQKLNYKHLIWNRLNLEVWKVHCSFFTEILLFVLSLCSTVHLTPGPPPGAASPYWTTCRASLPGEFFSQSTETVVKWTVCHFGRASIRLHKKDRVLQLCLPPPPLPHWHSPPVPASSPFCGGTFAVSGHHSQPHCPFISQNPHGGAAMNQFGVFVLKHPRVTQINWAL